MTILAPAMPLQPKKVTKGNPDTAVSKHKKKWDKPETDKAVSARLELARQKLINPRTGKPPLPMKQMGQAIGITDSHIKQILYYNAPVSAVLMARLYEAFGIEPNYLVIDKKAKKK